MNISRAHLSGILAFALWGLFPLYWKMFSQIGAWDLFAHRILWSFITLFLILMLRKKTSFVKEIWNDKKTRWMLIASSLLISSNWLLYIYAINIGKVLEASMGYFLNPLINVFMGWLILKERMRPTQWPSVLLGIAAIVLIGIQSDLQNIPWLALLLSLTFAFYGLIRKFTNVGSLEGLAFETLVVVVPVMLYWSFQPSAHITEIIPIWKMALLILSGLITCTPLVLFAYSTKRLPLQTIAFIQYLSPSLKFICGLLIFQEPLSHERLQAFCLIWIALAWYTAESYLLCENRPE